MVHFVFKKAGLDKRPVSVDDGMIAKLISPQSFHGVVDISLAKMVDCHTEWDITHQPTAHGLWLNNFNDARIDVGEYGERFCHVLFLNPRTKNQRHEV
jgi:hypothetical protein